jgi:signal transduction histidine kinase
LLVILLVLGSAVYLLLDYSLTAEIDRNLENKADEVLKSTRVVGTLPFFLRQIVLPDVEVFAAPDVYLQVMAGNGEIAVKSQNLGNYTLPAPYNIKEELVREKKSFVTLSVQNEKLRMVVKPLLLGGELVGILQVARPLKPVTLALARLRGIIILGGFVSLFISLFLGWFMSGKVLKPIEDLTGEARAIGEEKDFRRRVKYEGPKDELGELAVTFNTMLESLEEAYGRLNASLLAQQRFVADASHELRTPLTSIQGNVDFLRKLCEEGRDIQLEKEVLSDIDSETRRLSRLVKELLTLARADAGFNLELSPVDIAPLLEDTVRQARYLVKGQVFETDLEEASGAVIKADADYFKQMLLIFFDNAFKYTPSGKRVLFSAKRRGEKLALVFEDEGQGIPPKDIPHLFERFYRAKESRTGEGTGLGLAIASWIAGQHHGEITVKSEYGRGSVFTILVPLLRLF